MEKPGMNRKWTAILSALILLSFMIPQVYAGTGSLSPEDSRLAKTVTKDADGHLLNISYYNENEKILASEDFNPYDPEFSGREYYTYDESGQLLQEYIYVLNGDMEKITYEYGPHDLLKKTSCRDEGDNLVWIEEYTYNSDGDAVSIKYQDSEGYVYIKEMEYDGTGREIAGRETEIFNGESSVWHTEKTYSGSPGSSWSVTTQIFDESDSLVDSYTESWEYNSRGNLVSSVEMEEGALYKTVNIYDSHDLLVRTEVTAADDPDGDMFFSNFHYRQDDRLEKEIYGFGGYVYTTEYFYSLKPFSDVMDTEYFALPVKWAVDHGITTGITPEEFGPGDSCTRAQAVTFLWRAAGSPEPASAVNPFKDVSPKEYYYKPVLWAVEQGITKGVSEDRFGPGLTCNRGQIVTFLHRFRGEPEIGGTAAFKDVHESDYFYGAVLWAVADNVTNGTSATAFSPGNNCTRGQIVTFLYRTMNAD